MHLKTQGLVLREVNYKEADKILTVLTRDYGKVTLKARGVRRAGSPLKAACQLLAYGEFTFFEYRGMSTINEATALELFPALRQDLELLSLGTYFAQVAEVLSQEDAPSPELLSLTLNAMYAMTTLQKPQNLVKSAFELRIVSYAGYTPDLEACHICGNPYPDRFVLSDGCLECSSCHSLDGLHMPISPGALDAMRHIVMCPPGQLFSFRLESSSMTQLSHITEAYLSTQLERSFSTLDFYKSLFLGTMST